MRKLAVLLLVILTLSGCQKAETVHPATEPPIFAVTVDDFSPYYQLFDASGEERNWYHAALGCLFSSPEEIQLNMMFYLGVNGGGWLDISQESRNYLISKEFMIDMDLQVMPSEILDEIIESTFGMHLSDIPIPSEWAYISVEDAYCSNHNDAYFPGPFTITHIIEYSNGIIDITYTTDAIYDIVNDQFLTSPTLSLRLHKSQDGNFHIISNTIG